MGGYGYTYKLQIDFGHLGTYAHKLADCTARLQDFSLSMGNTSSDPFVAIAQPSRLTLNLLNHDGLLKPENTLSPYYGLLTRGTLVKLTASYAGTAYITWFGKLKNSQPFIHPHNDPAKNNQVALTVEDPMLQLLSAQIFPLLQTDVLIHDAIANVIEDAATAIVYPYASYWSVVDVSVVGTAKVLGQDIYTNSDSTTELPYLGDNASDPLNSVGAKSMLTDLMDAELGGRFFWNGQKFEFQHRYYAIENASGTPAITFYSEDIEDAKYIDSADLMNDMTITYQPRAVGVEGTVIYSAEKPIFVGAQQSRTVTCHYRDPNTPTARIGAAAVIDLVAGTDYIANSAQDGTGTVLTASIAAVQNQKAQSSSITLFNSGSTDAWVTTLQVRGTPLTTYERETVRAVDAQSVYDYDRYPQKLSLKLVQDDETAQGYANIMVSRFKTPFARFASTTHVVNQSLKLLTANLAIGDTVAINEYKSTKHNRQYTVVGITHRCDAESRVHRTTYYYSPIANEAFWLLGMPGFSELDSTAIPAV